MLGIALRHLGLLSLYHGRGHLSVVVQGAYQHAGCCVPLSQGLLEAVDKEAIKKGIKGKVRGASTVVSRGRPCTRCLDPKRGQT